MTRKDTSATTQNKDISAHPITDDRRVNSQWLLGPEGRVIIEHDGQRYLLRKTHAGKLILTK